MWFSDATSSVDTKYTYLSIINYTQISIVNVTSNIYVTSNI